MERGYENLDVILTWDSERIGSSLDQPTATDFALAIWNFQVAYEETLKALQIPVHNLQVTELKHPNMSLKLKGVAEAITAFKDLLLAVPEVVLGFVTLVPRARNTMLELKLNRELMELVREAITTVRDAPVDEKATCLREHLAYLSSGLSLPKLGFSITSAVIKGSETEPSVTPDWLPPDTSASPAYDPDSAREKTVAKKSPSPKKWR